MKRKSLMLLFSIPFALALAGIAACEEECTHTYADTLSSDSEYHWYAATCEHTDMKGEAEPHKDANDDGVCDVCEYDADHVHTYDETWTSNETKHWYAAKCTHSVKKDEADHVDENNDGVCDVCGWSADATHQHTFKTVWSTDATHHWYDAKCEHDVEVKIAHVDEDENNSCDVCGYDTYDISAVIASATSATSKAKVASTVFNYSNPYDVEYVDDGSGDYNTYVKNYVYTFTYGADNYAKQECAVSYIVEDWSGYEKVDVSKVETYYSMVNEDNIFALVKDFGTDLTVEDDDMLTRNMDADVAEMNGCAFDVNILDGMEYGVEAMIAALYNEARTSNLVFNYANGEMVEDEGTYYWFNFLYITESGYGYDYEIAFSLEEGAINRLYMYVGEYAESDLVANYNNETEEMEYLFKDEAEPFQGRVYEVTQTIGERTAVVPNEYDMDSYLLTSFKLSDGLNEYEDGATITIHAADQLMLSLAGDGVADKAAYNKVEFSGDLPGYASDGEWKLYASQNKVAGTYTLTASTDLASVTITVVINWQELTSLSVHQSGKFGNYQEVTTATIYAGKEFVFKPVANSGANNAVAVGITGTEITSEDYTLSYNSPDYIFSSTKIGTYTITLTSTVNEQITVSVIVTVAEAPNVSEILSGTKRYTDSFGFIQFVFTPSSAGATSGTVVITGSYFDKWGTQETYTINKTVNYVYNESSNEIELSGEESEQFELGFEEEFVLIGGWYYQYGFDAYWQWSMPYSGQLTTVVSDPV